MTSLVEDSWGLSCALWETWASPHHFVSLPHSSFCMSSLSIFVREPLCSLWTWMLLLSVKSGLFSISHYFRAVDVTGWIWSYPCCRLFRLSLPLFWCCFQHTVCSTKWKPKCPFSETWMFTVGIGAICFSFWLPGSCLLYGVINKHALNTNMSGEGEGHQNNSKGQKAHVWISRLLTSQPLLSPDPFLRFHTHLL